MATPTPSHTQLVASGGDISTALTTTAYTPAVGDIIVVKCACSSGSQTLLTPTNSGGAVTWTRRCLYDTTNGNTGTIYGANSLWTGVVTTSASMTISMGAPTPTPATFSIMVEFWSTATCKLAGTPATVQTTGNGTTETGTLTSAAANSTLSMGYIDDYPKNPSGYTYRTTSTDEGTDNQYATSSYVAYYAYQAAVTAGGQTVGMTAPTAQNWTIYGIEIQSQPAASSIPNVNMASQRN